jgi:hypothetical protein
MAPTHWWLPLQSTNNNTIVWANASTPPPTTTPAPVVVGITPAGADDDGVWTGEGPPPDDLDAEPGQSYIDTLSGTIYKFEE